MRIQYIIFLISISFSQIEYDPVKIKGAESCGNCHKAAVEHWKTTSHFKVFSGTESSPAMHRRPESKQILKKMGMKSAKRGLCTNCHFTLQQKEGKKRAKAISGPSCESCHGEAKNWIEIHGVYGNNANGGKATRETEQHLHKIERLTNADNLGMIRTHDIYNIVENCFKCHTVPNEELVNIGGHISGSDIDFQQWLSKEIKHNFLYSNGEINRDAPKDFDINNRKIKNHLVGLLVDLEYSIRGYTNATIDGHYSSEMKKRVDTAIIRLNEINSSHKDAKVINNVLTLVENIKIEINNSTNLLSIADEIKKISKDYSQN